jgi:uroporphyrinogen decarboxylase
MKLGGSPMKRKERFMTAMSLGQPDKVPVKDFLFSQAVFEEVLGEKVDAYEATAAVRCATKLGFDAIWIPVGGYAGYTPEDIGNNKYIDEWGTTYQHGETSWPIDPPVAYPIKNREDYKNWTAPNPSDPERAFPLRDAIKCNDSELAILSGVLGPFTCVGMLMGYEDMALAFYDDPELIAELLEEGANFSIECGKLLFEAGADALILSDDLGYSAGLFVSPDMMRSMVLPVIKRMVSEYQKIGAKVLLHCDGNINQILPDIIATGINALHPIERKAHMDISQVKRDFGKDICIVGNVNASTTLPYGTFEEIEEEVKECLRVAAPGGGYVIGSDHSISQGIPVKNALHFFEMVQKYRDYPIDL